tara:strand:+ start:928 stop:1269 length:342 start_codon:yes stop_codon:yes gene_type:complete
MQEQQNTEAREHLHNFIDSINFEQLQVKQQNAEGRERFDNFIDAINVEQRYKPFQVTTGIYMDDLLAWNIPYRTEQITDFVAWTSENPKLYHITNGDKSVVIAKSDAMKYFHQ